MIQECSIWAVLFYMEANGCSPNGYIQMIKCGAILVTMMLRPETIFPFSVINNAFQIDGQWKQMNKIDKNSKKEKNYPDNISGISIFKLQNNNMLGFLPSAPI